MTTFQQRSPFDTIYCPRCRHLLLDAPACPNGDWERPAPGERIGSVRWQTQLDGVLGKPYVAGATAGGLFIIPVEKETAQEQQVTLVALHMQTGAVVWSRPLPGRGIARFLAVVAGRLFASFEHTGVLASAPSSVTAIDYESGETAWQTELPAHSHSAPAPLGELLVVAASDHRVYALDGNDGTLVWQSAPLPSWSPAPPTIAAGRIFAGGYTHVISGVSADGDAQEWVRAPDKSAWFDLPLAADGDTVYAACSDKHVYAIDAKNGGLRWSQQMGRGCTAPPTAGAAGAYLYVPMKTYEKGEYLVRAVSVEEGATAWQFQADSHVLAPPLLCEGALFCGSRKGKLYALDAETGTVRWQVETDSAIRSVPATGGSHLFFGTADGVVYSALWREVAPEPLHPAETYRDQQQWLLAGTAAAHDGAWRAAADDFARAGLPLVAAQCYEQDGAWAEAAPLYAEAGDLARAVTAYEEAGDRRNAAELTLRLQQPERAAALFAQVGEHARAARLYHETGRLNRAAACYARAGKPEEALKLYRALEQHAHVAKLARELGHFRQEAEASLALARQSPAEDYLHYRAAAHALVRAAQQQEAQQEPELVDEALADLWQRAADYFERGMIGDKELIARCRLAVLRWRGWPRLALDVQAERKLAIGRWDRLIVQIKNVGFGVARHVSVKVVESEFDGRLDTQAYAGILPERTEQLRLNVRPRSAGSSVPLAIRLAYTRPDGEEIMRVIHATVPVHDRDARDITSEKEIGQRTRIPLHQDAAFADDAGRYQQIIIQGDYYSVDQVRGSAVSIGRESAAASDATAPEEERGKGERDE